MSYGLKLKLCRERCGLTQVEAAKILGISRNTLSRYENNETTLPLTVFINMARLYKCDVFDVMGVRDASLHNELEFDVHPYYLLKAHARHTVAAEKETDENFGTILPEEYYDSRFRDKLREIVDNPIYNLYFKGLKDQEDIDNVTFFD